MDRSLKHRLRIAYPTGMAWEPDLSMLGANAQDARLEVALGDLGQLCGVRVEPSFAPPRLVRERVITDSDAPAFDTWFWRMSHANKVDWIRQSDRLYVTLWLKVSRIADYYIFYFNHWRPRGDTGYVDPDHRIEPDPRWQEIALRLDEALACHGFQKASDALVGERASFVLDEFWEEVDDDDPRLEDPDFGPSLVPTTLQTCLFGGP